MGLPPDYTHHNQISSNDWLGASMPAAAVEAAVVEAAVAGAPHNVLHCIRPNASCSLEPPPSSCSVFRWSGLCSASHSRRFAKTAVHRWIGRFGRQGKSSANTNWVVIDATAATMTLTIIRSVLFNRAVQCWLSFVCFAKNGAGSVKLQNSWMQLWFSLVQFCFCDGSVWHIFCLTCLALV